MVYLKKLTYIISMLWLISIISFLAIHLAPNSFLSGGELNPNMTQESIAILKGIYGLDKPLIEQYFDWVFNILTFSFGISFVSGKEVSLLIKDHLPITLILNSITLVIVFILSLWLGIQSAFNESFSKKVKFLSLLSFSMPSFYLALMLLLYFSVQLQWFPLGGIASNTNPLFQSVYLDTAWHLFLPLVVMIFSGFGSLAMYVRSLTLEILKSDYIFFAKARGLGKKQILKSMILPNLIPPIVTILGLSLPGLIGGSVILESIFSIDGMGLLFYQSALSRDYPVIMGILIITAFLTLVGNILADLFLLIYNPFYKK